MVYYLITGLMIRGYGPLSYILGIFVTYLNASRVARMEDLPENQKAPLFMFWFLFETLVMCVYLSWLHELAG